MNKMARMHSRRKGKSGSKRPFSDKTRVWVKYSAEEVSKIIDKLHKSGKNPSQIGMILRDSYGIPNVRTILEKRLISSMKEKNIKFEIPEDIMYLIKKEMSIAKHLSRNKKDMPSKRGLQLTESKIRRLVKHYKRAGVLPKDWVYDREKAKLIIG